MDLNKVMIIGRLTRDPEVRTIPSGQTVANIAVATNFSFKDQAGNRQDRPEYHDVVLWRRLGEIAGQYLKKGTRVYIEGRLQTRSWDDPNGFKRYKTEIIADNMIMLDRPAGDTGGYAPRSFAGAPTPAAPNQAKAAPSRLEEELPTIDVSEDASLSSSDEEEISVEDIPF